MVYSVFTLTAPGFEKPEHHGHELSTPTPAGTASHLAMNHHGAYGVDDGEDSVDKLAIF